MQQLLIASNNSGKIKEIKALVEHIELLSLSDVGFFGDIEEPWDTFEQNAFAKADELNRFCGKNVFADDSGLCVHALGGAPGVDSAHYCGLRNDELNLHQVLLELKDAADRSAYYKAVICLIWNGEVHYFEGICEGSITHEKTGTGGFGYDPIFVPNGYNITFGQLPLSVKNQISHRAVAINKMVKFIEQRIAIAE
jgi:XTP/dITP diphosphohydrolase